MKGFDEVAKTIEGKGDLRDIYDQSQAVMTSVVKGDDDSGKTRKAAKEYGFAETWTFISQGKGDLRGIYDRAPAPLPMTSRPMRKRMTPSVLCKKLFCPAFVPKPYSSEPFEKRQEYDVLAQMSVVKTILRMTKMGYRFVESEVPSGKFNGRVDLVFQGPDGPKTKVEVKGSKSLRPWDIVQGILYHRSDSKIAIASINEFLEPEDWLIESVKAAALELDEFMQEFPEKAAEIRLPHSKLCWKCADPKCPFRKSN